MQWAIFSDVHGNLPALQRFIECTSSADAFLCLGDVVNYGPWNDECLELVHSLPNLVFLEGNHERLFLGLDPLEYEMDLVRAFTEHSLRSFTRKDLISALPDEHLLGRFRCMHTLNGMRIYADTEFAPPQNLIVGHTHHQFLIPRGDKVVINCGSIGQNRRRIDQIDYALYDTDADRIELLSAAYAVEVIIREFEIRDYPRRCLDYYLGKIPAPVCSIS